MNLSELLNEFNIVLHIPEALNELRSLILGLAVRGKLVPQDPDDEPAAELLKKIEAEKERLYEEGEIRKPKKVKKISKDEYPFQIPDNWVWTNLNEAGVINPRNDAEDDLDASFISMSLISEGFMEMHDSEKRKWKEIKSGYTHFAENDVGLAKITPCFQNGKAAIFRNLTNSIGAGTTELYIFRSIFEGLIPEYVYAFLRTPDFVNHGIEVMTGTAGHQRVPKSYFEHRPFPLPPANEQHRIVQKIQSLFAEVDDLEAKLNHQTKLDEKLQVAVNAEVQRAPDAEASKSAWSFITSNFDTLYHTPEAIDNLKKNILNEAVRGRLVPQNPNDEPASELLKKIEAEKQRLYEEGEIRKPKKLPPVKEDEIPFEIPGSWEWCRLGALGYFTGGGTPSKNKQEYWDGDIPWISPKDMKDDFISGAEMSITELGVENSSAKLIPHKSILIVARSGILKRTLPVGINTVICSVNQDIKVIVPYQKNLSRYLSIMLKGFEPHILTNLVKQGMTVQSLKYSEFENEPFPIPPLEEQHRIVRRIEELFAICDRFKAQLEQREKVNERLVKGLVQEVLEKTGVKSSS
jgi:type I restriction enzyme, S subunit